jgi:hypothetical protein
MLYNSTVQTQGESSGMSRHSTVGIKDTYWVSLTHSLTHGAEPFLRSRQLCSYSRTSQYIMEPEGSLAYSQEPSIGPYPEPDRSTPFHPITLRSILILFTSLRLCLPNSFLPSGFPTNILYAFLFSPFVLHALPILGYHQILYKKQMFNT